MTYAFQNRPQSEMTADPSKYPNGYFRTKPCKECGTEFQPKAPSHKTCSQRCANRLLTSRYLTRTYGLTLVDYERMLQEQNWKCWICEGEGFCMAKHHKLKLVVDHCHTSGRVRGLLCHNCNRALGLLKDSEGALLRALEYLKA